MFGLKKEEVIKTDKACPFTFALTRREDKVNKFGMCITASCQMWDEKRNDCGLKQK
ncbi:hypothetical protein [Brevibacillus sp. HD3.3A]|uniref:hypothetical protein n=1 Tax=Brevibacillus sp. HD3.3A TaxID=2738979 RepID=UPI00156A7ED5|nr:hypothetical protein [Brevibacillus sp. HD3.3A]UED72157.1 hypothetical protein HP435_29060 [Brevibacillus sp. HD3.3A]